MEESKDLGEFDKILESLKESMPKSKEYYKFLIGLSTGTLIFSVTFMKEFIRGPQYKFILVLGWVCLLVSIIVGVWLFSKLDSLYSNVALLKGLFTKFSGNFKPEVIASVKGELREYFARIFLKADLDATLKGDGKELDELHRLVEKLPIEKLPIEKLKEILQKHEEILSSHFDNKRAGKLFGDFRKEFFKFTDWISKVAEPQLYFPNVLKQLRRSFQQLYYLEKVMRYAFFFGVLGIALFSIINFLC